MSRKLDSAEMAGQFCNRLDNLRPNTPGRWGKMTPHQMICHLTDSFRAVNGEKRVSSAVNLLGRTLMRWGALHTPVVWPHGVPTMPEMAQEIGGTPPAEWQSDCDELKRRIAEFPGQTTFPLHPIMGSLTANEWRIWGYRHTDHHFRQFGL